ncbi:CIR protein [Plasmodium chabaudi adami]|uniref:CIR protein n=1 Tax=Plasmodium chabaudi adami TaxID=5826 RepID=A0A1C6WN42_PLACE|nr:CIR protein [Plasmodium chabaudi adami]
MNYNEACDIFREFDKLFVNYKSNEEQFNANSGLYNNYCPAKNGSKKCDTDYEKVSAISGHIYTELKKKNEINIDSEYDRGIDFWVMGWCHGLYKISTDHNLSLKQSYETYLGKSRGNFNYKGILYNKKHLMDSKIAIMNMFYLLFQQICETIKKYQTKHVLGYEYISAATQCHIMYSELSKFVNHCGPYLQLLGHLKAIYNEFIKAAIKENNYDQSILNQLKKLQLIDKTNAGSNFNTKECKQVHQKLEKKISRLKSESQEELNALMELLVSDDDNIGGNEDNDKDNALGNTNDITDELSNQLKCSEKHSPNSNQGISHDDSSKQNDKPEEKNPETENNDEGEVNTGGKLGSHEEDSRNTKVELTNRNDEPTNIDNEKKDIQDKENIGENDIKDPMVDTDDQKENSNIQQEGSGGENDDFEKTESTMNNLHNIKNILGMPSAFFMKISTNKVNHLYYTTLTNLETAYDRFSASAKTVINQVTEHFQKHSIPTKETTPPLCNKEPEIQMPPSSSTDSPTDPPTDSSTGSSTNKNGESINYNSLMTNPVNEPDIHLDKKEESIQKVIFPGNIFKGGTPTYVKSIVILIPIILLIMYKYLSPWRRKKSKRKTNMKKVINLVDVNKTTKTIINSTDGKKQMQLIIKSSSRKKRTKKSINSVYRGKSSSLNIYKLMQADPVPFINLFFLLIFFVYKRKRDCIE